MKKLIALLLLLCTFALSFNALQINATLINETIEDSNVELIGGEGDASVTSSGEGYGKPDDYGEYWYILSTDTPTFGNQEVEIDYEEMPELLKYLKPGDIIYETNDSIIGDVTGHIAIVYDILWDEDHQQFYVSIIEAYTGGVGYSIMTPNRFDAKKVIIYRLKDASDTQIQGALAWLEEKCGDYFKFHTRKYLNGLVEVDDKGNETTYWYCAELIWAAFMSPEDDEQKIGLDWDNNTDGGNLISPHALALSPHLTTILHYTDEDDEDKYETILTNNGATGHTYSCNGDVYTEEHFYRFWTAGDETHTATCACGHTITENHSLEYEDLDESDYHREYCTVCAYNETVSHDYKCYGTIGEFHSEMCLECGYHHMGLVNIPYTSVDENNHSKTCPDCGYTITEAHNYETYNYCYEKCADCGHIRQAKEHDYTHRYSSVNDETHYAYCECGEYITASHNHQEYLPCSDKCVDCGHKKVIGVHTYTDEYEYRNTGMHEAYCACGASILGGHFYQVKEEGQLILDVCMFCKVEKNHVHDYVYTSSMDGKTHHTSCWCGISKYEQCFGIAIQGELRRCDKCNQVLSGGLIVPWGDDGEEDALPAGKEDEEYLEQTE